MTKTFKAAGALLLAGVATVAAQTAWAKVSEEEAKQLGTTLTEFGAIKEGNKEGTIPAYTGGLTASAPSYKPGSGRYPDPYPGDKPQFSISAKNMDQYADKLTDGTKELMRRYPSFRIDVYPTRRSVVLPDSVLKASVKNATTAYTEDNGVSLKGASGGVAFPIPKTGSEAMWNHLTHYNGTQIRLLNYMSLVVDAAGARITSADGEHVQYFPYYDPAVTDGKYYSYTRYETLGPPRNVGQINLIHEPIDYSTADKKIWSYLPGQRRVKLAPELTYDTPETTSSGGLQVWDDVFLFTGKMDRFDFKLVGKKEVFIPYNSNKVVFPDSQDQLTTPNHLNPDLVRWELHRVWEVEATLKPNFRHVYQKRRFYLDEDMLSISAIDNFDAGGKLYRVGFSFPVVMPDAKVTYAMPIWYDLQKRAYLLSTSGDKGTVTFPPIKPRSFYQPDALTGSGVN